MAETLCPNCGYSPIPAGAETCPECNEPFGFLQMHKRAQRRFVDRKLDHEDNEMTVFGGNVTGEVSAHPGPAAVVLFAGAIAWFLRVGVFNTLHEPLWVYGLVLLDLVLGLLIFVSVGPAKGIAQAGLVLQLAVTAFLARGAWQAPVHVAFMAYTLVALVAVTGEPGTLRRNICLGLGLGAVALAAVFLVFPVGLQQPGGAGGRVDRQMLVGRELGFQLELPAGWGRLERAELEPYLTLPAATLTGSGVAFGNVEQGRFGMLWVDRKAGLSLTGGCQDVLRAVGGGEGKPLARPAPTALGAKALVYDLRTPAGGQGVLGCGQLEDGRLVGLAVVSSGEGTSGEAAFAAVGSGLALQ
ncbi:zinc ribbon domain-containing protein [Myxococcaceae bacterium GXIMD 01537]